MNYFISAIGTDSGKTIASAILVEALQADYWKPIQAGRPTDSDTIRQLVSEHLVIHPERHLLETPASPHAAAAVEEKKIQVSDFNLPHTSNSLVIEGAGGLMVPINNDELIVDMIPRFNAELILVSNIYLGSINHTLLSLEVIKSRGYPLKGIIFNGISTPSTESIILKYAQVPCLLHIKPEGQIDPVVIKKYANEFNYNWNELARKG
ncbi:Dethiobiotin synthetase [Fulvivirga imtechensis AK7]|uniref:ATP-dependent dethiobiotin synthetase BioD n=1 Tax=Fulvivirga imtechensis AK7 TaxID=1237149 RepID=L8JZD8_9BACT|nr:dethiobiotin synthase [Fulvivirga imtechensis]ELR73523.1 Dethiobiotin synthetase [Fulvivirga imtechensis AK7]